MKTAPLITLSLLIFIATIDETMTSESGPKMVIRHSSRDPIDLSTYFWKPEKFSYLPINSAMKQQFVDAHNRARASVMPQASNMIALEWSDQVAKMSQKFVRKCKFAHSSPHARVMAGYAYPLGENLFVGVSISKLHTNPYYVVLKWDEEKKYYDYDTPSCVPGKMCGHYTQVVWATSRKIGCAIGHCPSVKVRGSKKNKYDILVACHYAPNGNFHGEQPYKSGVPCSECPYSRKICKNNLCTR